MMSPGAPPRQGIVVGLSALGLHCCLPETDHLSETELADILARADDARFRMADAIQVELLG